jgi:hypothetical protein
MADFHCGNQCDTMRHGKKIGRLDILAPLARLNTREDLMHKTVLLAGCAMLFAAPVFQTSPAQAKVGDDNFVIMAQGEPGPPIGGTTGAGGNGGAGNYDAGTERGESYDAPMNPAAYHDPANPAANLPNAATTGDQSRRSSYRHGSNDTNETTSDETTPE